MYGITDNAILLWKYFYTIFLYERRFLFWCYNGRIQQYRYKFINTLWKPSKTRARKDGAASAPTKLDAPRAAASGQPRRKRRRLPNWRACTLRMQLTPWLT